MPIGGNAISMAGPLDGLLQGVGVAAIAQVSRLLPDVRPLPDPPLVPYLVFEAPLWPAIVIAALGVLGLFGFGTRGRGGTGLLVLASGVVVAGSLLAAGALVTTDRERLLDATRRTIAATAEARTDDLRGLLHEDVRVMLPDRVPASSISGRAGVLAAVERQLGARYRVESWSIKGVQASVDGPGLARTQVGVTARAARGGPVLSWWLLDWRKVGDGWLVVGLELVSMPLLGIGTQESGPI